MKLSLWIPTAVLVVIGFALLAAFRGRNPTTQLSELAGKHFSEAPAIYVRPVGTGGSTGIEVKVFAASPILGCTIRSVTLDGTPPTDVAEFRTGSIPAGGAVTKTFRWQSASRTAAGTHEVSVQYELTFQDGFSLPHSFWRDKVVF